LEDALLSVPVPSDRNDLSYFKKLNDVTCCVAVWLLSILQRHNRRWDQPLPTPSYLI